MVGVCIVRYAWPSCVAGVVVTQHDLFEIAVGPHGWYMIECRKDIVRCQGSEQLVQIVGVGEGVYIRFIRGVYLADEALLEWALPGYAMVRHLESVGRFEYGDG